MAHRVRVSFPVRATLAIFPLISHLVNPRCQMQIQFYFGNPGELKTSFLPLICKKFKFKFLFSMVVKFLPRRVFDSL